MPRIAATAFAFAVRYPAGRKLVGPLVSWGAERDPWQPTYPLGRAVAEAALAAARADLARAERKNTHPGTCGHRLSDSVCYLPAGPHPDGYHRDLHGSRWDQGDVSPRRQTRRALERHLAEAEARAEGAERERDALHAKLQRRRQFAESGGKKLDDALARIARLEPAARGSKHQVRVLTARLDAVERVSYELRDEDMRKVLAALGGGAAARPGDAA